MRTIINISLPTELAKEVKLIVKKEKYLGLSDFVRELIISFQADQRMISTVEKSFAEYKAGKGKKLNNIRDLVK